MTNEISHLFQALKIWEKSRKKAVLVSVVALEGTSYRKPGVRMLISEDGEYAGAVSGGCVEKEIERQAKTVFQTGTAKIMTYDGRLRIGCEGVIHILIEPVFLSDELWLDFGSVLEAREDFKMDTWFYQKVGEYENIGTLMTLKGKTYVLNPSFTPDQITDQECFSQTFEPLFQLYIFGAEHDALQLSQVAKLLGWNVTIVASAEESKSCDYFPGASALITPAYDEISRLRIDEQTAVMLMTHSFNKDVQYLLALKNIQAAYIGMLGAKKRRERVFNMLLEIDSEIPFDFLDQIHGPAGISIGAESASEIAVSILAEILGVIRKQNPVSLREKTGSIHG
ncbi:XdhC family protein [Maribellus maritimus]|uniref:XdhC family protein n=1 Tax=Maribellus maritimus TaxID=2870838 RepID=UPI001EEC09C4|nr:XdhC/CoxI family protein [Maribellus maritimus]MCG6188847.1 XdhC family protein [Maribellus maritimus]